MNNTHQEGYRKHVLKQYLYQLQKVDSVHIEPSQPPYILYSPALIRPCEITFVGDLSDLGLNKLQVHNAHRIQNLLPSMKILCTLVLKSSMRLN